MTRECANNINLSEKNNTKLKVLTKCTHTYMQATCTHRKED